ncbi:Isoamyl acetate-hydrolyzing esterase 1 homolog [Podarcis lilfordi]|uniref:Isoamyl acetate-hydrolyzing esterase 1 homolog n=1 Tax=Podarcis lilfordi TaxID=74358 RepID=A0AA35K0I2_9SAUR|nr:Isoamyl acetate-hydrolyzing esterase 1 homolog [Podarcis lilfordi]
MPAGRAAALPKAPLLAAAAPPQLSGAEGKRCKERPQKRPASPPPTRPTPMALSEAQACGRRLLWSPPRVVLFGDSITEFSFQENGWGASLAHRLARKCDVLNRGLSGYNTRWAKIALPRLISKDSDAKNTVAVTVFFGANDGALKDVNPKQHVPLDEYADNLKSMIQYLKSVDITEDKVILVTPPPLHEAAWGKECIAKGEKLNRLNSTTGEYAKACVKVASDCGTSIIDLWTLMQKNNQV